MNHVSMASALLILIALIGCSAAPAGEALDKISESAVRVDRVGRGEITNFTVRAPAAKTPYNAADTFDLDQVFVHTYSMYLAAGVMAWDALDGSLQWSIPADPATGTPEAPAKPTLNAAGATFVGMLVDDYLVLDPSKPCDVDTESYLDIEKHLLRGERGGWTTCGGRTPNDDMIDTYISLLVAGPAADARAHGDGIDDPSAPATNRWPYFAEPHPAPEPAADVPAAEGD